MRPYYHALGLAPTEGTLIDECSGRIIKPSIAEHSVSVHLDVIVIDIPDRHGLPGARGVGGITIMGVDAAVANAIHNVTGMGVRNLSITLDKLL